MPYRKGCTDNDEQKQVCTGNVVHKYCAEICCTEKVGQETMYIQILYIQHYTEKFCADLFVQKILCIRWCTTNMVHENVVQSILYRKMRYTKYGAGRCYT